jgi:transcription elongation factor Elf1
MIGYYQICLFRKNIFYLKIKEKVFRYQNTLNIFMSCNFCLHEVVYTCEVKKYMLMKAINNRAKEHII